MADQVMSREDRVRLLQGVKDGPSVLNSTGDDEVIYIRRVFLGEAEGTPETTEAPAPAGDLEGERRGPAPLYMGEVCPRNDEEVVPAVNRSVLFGPR